MTDRAPLLAALTSALPPGTLSLDPDDLTEYGKDWTKVYAPAPLAIAFPKTREEVSTLLRLCSEHDRPVVPSGGRTGLAGGAVAARGEIVLSLVKMRALGEVGTNRPHLPRRGRRHHRGRPRAREASRAHLARRLRQQRLQLRRRQHRKFLKVVYENFYKAYNPKAADRLGIVYTPNEIVQFMIKSTDYLLHKHFGKTMADKNVEILDPATGTGTFICDIIDYLPKNKLEYKYKNELHANELAILPIILPT